MDSAVAALLAARRREAVAVTLELWRDPENDAEASCCSRARRPRRARGRARDGPAALHARPARGVPRGRRRAVPAEHAAGRDPQPCVRCNGHVRLDAMLDFADRLGAADLATGHYARVTPDGLLRAAADAAKDQTYMLAAPLRATLARLRFPLGELTKPEVRALAAEAGLPVAVQGRVAGPVLPRRHRARPRSSPATAALERPPGGDRRRRRARARRAPRRSTTSRSASARASASPRRSRSTCSPPTRAPTRSSVGTARRAGDPRGRACAARGCTGPPPRSTRSSCATARRAVPAGSPRAAAARRAGAAGARRRRRARARPPACCAATSIVGWGTIAA